MESRSVAIRIAIVTAVAVFVILAALIRANHPAAEVSSRPKARQDAQVKNSSLGSSEAIEKSEGEQQTPETSQARNSEKNPRNSRSAAKVDADVQGKALHDATLRTLIRNAKVAQQRGDLQTRDAMLQGLKKNSDRAKALLQAEISATRDMTIAYALQSLLKELQ